MEILETGKRAFSKIMDMVKEGVEKIAMVFLFSIVFLMVILTGYGISLLLNPGDGTKPLTKINHGYGSSEIRVDKVEVEGIRYHVFSAGNSIYAVRLEAKAEAK